MATRKTWRSDTSDMPTGLDLGKKRELINAIYGALHPAWSFPEDRLIFLREWPLHSG